MSDGGKFFDDRSARRATAEAAEAGLLTKLNTSTFDQSVTAGTNLVISPDFSDNTILRAVNSGAGGGYSTTRSHSGTQSYKVVQVAGTFHDLLLSGTSTNEGTSTNYYRVRPGEKYSAEGWVYAETANTGSKVMLWALFQDSTGVNSLLFADLSDQTIAKGSWVKLTSDVAIPAGYDRLTFALSARDTNSTGDVFYWDDALVRETTTRALLESSATAGTNLVIDPSFEDTSILRPVFDDPAVMTYSTDQAHSKTHCLKATHFSSLSAGFLMMPVPAPSTGFWNNTGAKFMRVSWLQKYRVKVWVFPKATNGPVNGGAILGVYLRNSITGAETWQELGHTPTLGVWQEISDIFEIPFGYDQMQPYAYTHGSFNSNGNIFYWDDPSVTDETWTQNIIQQLFGGPAIGSEILPASVPQLDWGKITNLIDMLLGKQGAGTNLVISPDLENTSIRRSAVGDYSTDQAHTGTRCWKFLPTDGVNPQDLNFGHTSSPVGTDAYTDNRQWFKVKEGQRYYYECWVFPKATNTLSGSQVLFQVGYRNAAGGSETFESYTTLTGGEAPLGVWTKLSGYFTVPAGKGLMLPDFHIFATASGNIFYADDLVLMEESATQDIISALISAWTGTAAGATNLVAVANTAMTGQKNTISQLASAVAQMQAIQAGNVNSGKSYAVSFASYPDGALPSIFTNTYTDSGSSTIQISGGYAFVVESGSPLSRQYNAVYNAGVTDSDYQIGSCSVPNLAEANSIVGISGANYIRLRSNTAGTTYVYLKILSDGFGNRYGELGCVVSGTPTVWFSPTIVPAADNYWLECGTSGGLRIYRVYAGSQLLYTHTEVGTASQIGAAYRSAAFGGDIATDGTFILSPGMVASFQFADNLPPATVGSGVFMTRTNTGTQSIGTGEQLLADGYYTPVRSTTDYSVNPTTQGVTILKDGWYAVTVGIKASTNQNTQLAALIYNNTTLLRKAPEQVNVTLIGHTFMEYLTAGMVIRPGIYVAFATFNITGEASGTQAYFGVTLINNTKS